MVVSQKLEKALESLNDEQREAVVNYEGSYFVLAGPGSGKTHTMVHRVAYMIESGVRPSSIVLFTFTNKAAEELKERTKHVVGNKADQIVVGTYHSVCARLLRRYVTILGNYDSNFTIYSADDTLSILKPLAKENGVEVKDLHSYISSLKNKMITPTQLYNEAPTSFIKRMALVYQEYQNTLEQSNAMDFDDLIWNMIKVMELDLNVKRQLNEKFKYVISDEAHDSNPRDLKLIKMLAGEGENVCFVLDPNQSIYGFRGSDVNAVLNVPNQYRNLRTINLKYNYRSSQSIVSASESLISHNEQPEDREIKTINEEGEPVFYMETKSSEEEATRITSAIKALHATGEEYKEIAILVRMNYLTRSLEKALTLAKIPYVVKSSVGFFQRKEIKDLLSYIRVLYNPHDKVAFQRIVNTPSRRIGPKSLEKIMDQYEQNEGEINLLEACEAADFTGATGKNVEDFLSTMKELKHMTEIGEQPFKILKALNQLIGYNQYIAEYEDNEAILSDRMENISELENMSSLYINLDELIQDSSLFSSSNEDEDDEDDENKVTIMTMHSSKGLEWDNVFISSFVDNITPHHKAINAGDVTEERRLFYVAMTRARKKLFLTRAKFTFTNGRLMATKRSRFLNEIKDHIIVI